MMEKLTTIVLGASDNPERYSFRAIKALVDNDHPTAGVHPRLQSISGVGVFKSLELAARSLGTVDTITMYVGAKRSTPMLEAIVAANPRRVIFNPGAENEELSQKLSAHKIECIEACTLVLLATNQY